MPPHLPTHTSQHILLDLHVPVQSSPHCSPKCAPSRGAKLPGCERAVTACEHPRLSHIPLITSPISRPFPKKREWEEGCRKGVGGAIKMSGPFLCASFSRFLPSPLSPLYSSPSLHLSSLPQTLLQWRLRQWHLGDEAGEVNYCSPTPHAPP